MRSQSFFLLLAFVCMLAKPARAAQVLVSGNSMDSSNPGFTSRLDSLGHSYTYVPPASFIGTSLSGFNVIWLDGFSLYNSGLSPKLTDFLNGGGTVLVQSPGFGSEPLSDYPLGSTLSTVFTFPPGENLVRITVPGHPINAGLTQADLSGWNPSGAGYFTASGDFTVLMDNGESDQFITLVQNVGAGTLVYTQQGISQRLTTLNDPGALTLLNNVIVTVVPEPSVIGLWVLGAGMLVAGVNARRRMSSGGGRNERG